MWHVSGTETEGTKGRIIPGHSVARGANPSAASPGKSFRQDIGGFQPELKVLKRREADIAIDLLARRIFDRPVLFVALAPILS